MRKVNAGIVCITGLIGVLTGIQEQAQQTAAAQKVAEPKSVRVVTSPWFSSGYPPGSLKSEIYVTGYGQTPVAMRIEMPGAPAPDGDILHPDIGFVPMNANGRRSAGFDPGEVIQRGQFKLVIGDNGKTARLYRAGHRHPAVTLELVARKKGPDFFLTLDLSEGAKTSTQVAVGRSGKFATARLIEGLRRQKYFQLVSWINMSPVYRGVGPEGFTNEWLAEPGIPKSKLTQRSAPQRLSPVFNQVFRASVPS